MFVMHIHPKITIKNPFFKGINKTLDVKANGIWTLKIYAMLNKWINFLKLIVFHLKN